MKLSYLPLVFVLGHSAYAASDDIAGISSFVVDGTISNGLEHEEVEDEFSIESASALPALIKVGKELWDVVKENKSVSNISSDYLSVLPSGATSAMSLVGWQSGESPKVKVLVEDIFGADLVKFSYRITYDYRGAYKRKGQYIANLTLIPETLDINAVGLDFNVKVKTLEPKNVGTEASPIASVQMLVTIEVDGILNSVTKTDEFTLDANGKYKFVQRSSEKWSR